MNGHAGKMNGHEGDKMNGHVDKIDVRNKINGHLDMNGHAQTNGVAHDLEIKNLKNGHRMDLGTPKIQKVAVKI